MRDAHTSGWGRASQHTRLFVILVAKISFDFVNGRTALFTTQSIYLLLHSRLIFYIITVTMGSISEQATKMV